MSISRSVVDVSGLPDNVDGPRSVVWWGTLSFMMIEGTSLAITAAAYLYLRRNFPMLPPARIQPPGLQAAVTNVVLMLVSFVPAHLLKKSGADKRMAGVKLWLLVMLGFSVAFVLLRWLELRQLHVWYDTNAYGSAAWLVLVTHGTLLAVEVGEVGMMALMAWTGRWEEKHFSDVQDVSFYWYFMVLSWLPLFAIVFLLPRML